MIYTFKKYIRELSYTNKFIKRIYLLANGVKVKILQGLKDETFAKIKYKENTGEVLDLKHPKRYNEKLWWLKINNRDPLMTVCSDKYEVREYVRNCGLEHILIKNYGVFDSAEEINFDLLPDKAIIKVNHGSGTNTLFDRSRPFNRNHFIKKFNKSLKQNYYYQSREWNYKNIKPRIVVEKFLEDKNYSTLIDYRFMCFEGEAKLLLVDIDTMAPDGAHAPEAKRNIYDLEFNKIDMKIGRVNFNDNFLKKPEDFNKMIEYAEILSKPFPHCRVDLYYVNQKIYFGEITFYPGGSTQQITPSEWDTRLGTWINLKSKKIHLAK